MGDIVMLLGVKCDNLGVVKSGLDQVHFKQNLIVAKFVIVNS